MKHYSELTACRICPRNCGVDRYQSTGFCGAGAELEVNLGQLHYGEEPVISGTRGSGTIFFSHCNLKCVFCQNYEISALGWGERLSEDQLAAMMLDLQTQGAHNINLVSPSHYQPQIVQSILLAKDQGLTIPIVWNSNAYETRDSIRALNGIVDIFLPDFKYAYSAYSKKYSLAADYPKLAIEAIAEMQKQVGLITLDQDGIAKRGLIIRILVLPNNLAGVSRILDHIADELGTEPQLSLMAQYYPTHQAAQYQELNRGITIAEYEQALDAVHARGFRNVWIQELSCSSDWTPDFFAPNSDEHRESNAYES